jgi:signal transduction histidine kinase/ActR/RegA family two-component response regulator
MDMFVPDKNWPETRIMIEKVLAGENISGVETQRFTKTCDIIPVSISGAIYNDRDGNPAGSVVNLRNISEQKKLEAQIQQAHKMEAIGTLAGGIAHDFNNLLMGILGNASLISLDFDFSHPHHEKIKNIEKYVISGADLTKQLLGFAKGGKYEVKPVDINDLIEKSSDMFSRAKKEIRFHRKYQKDIWTIEVDPSQIEQVLLNLYVNAGQAMPSGGDLYLETENVTLDENYVRHFSVESGSYVKFSVKDTGVGMDENTLKRMFDPFFTTKERSRGTGLGLASAYGIIKNHGGIINAHSVLGKGTAFDVYLPASRKKVVKEKYLDQKALQGTETVLFVDDEEIIIDIGRQILSSLGYQVIMAKSGKEAIEIYRANKNKINMVILDMIMPDIGGGETYDRLKEINPEIKVLLSSGYSIDGQASEIMNRGCNGFIQKPFLIKQLSQKIRDILDKEYES